ncbi:hypothetical protein EDB60_102536 [Vibrio crassostreae]|nr:hypothetical protein EDB33_101264 [Vibrio crassostreae]ROP25972.1 hypothetical protein EDB34_101264 [Vibrio crassostreae]RPF00541.1 hypothetical protein EDB15_101264 [Vibrio crassostreae]TCN73853.1 hypothetical protein EDB60_102536 [Vibrio crassostreae]TCT78924.1 hypothetical protein EDB46_101494 [Vibrio crassostreae]
MSLGLFVGRVVLNQCSKLNDVYSLATASLIC